MRRLCYSENASNTLLKSGETLKRNEKPREGLGEIVTNCPKCGAAVAENSIVCTNCGSVLQPHQSLAASSNQPISTSAPQSKSPTWSQPYKTSKDTSNRDAILGVICAAVSLLFLPEIFGSAAIILGAYTWKKKPGNLGLIILIIGIICMILGIEVLAYI